MIQVMKFLNIIVSVYMMIIFVRIILTWFSWQRESSLVRVLSKITDPYLNWFRRFSFLRAGHIDFSPIVALAVLSLVNRVLAAISGYGKITVGMVLALILQLAWGIVSFIIGFSIVILILRFILQYAVKNGENPFWHIIRNLSQTILYRITRLFVRKRIVNFKTGMIISILSLVVIYFLLRYLVLWASAALAGLPF